jgi:hypothetical protein
MSIAAAMLLAAAAEFPPICTDRPGKANGICTVPVGTWQVESSAADWLRLEEDGSESEALLFGSTFVKLGLSDRSDLQLGVTPYVRFTVDGHHASGFGDIIVRYKHRLTASDAKVQVAVIPFVKLPTADSDIGNGKAEGGLAGAISFSLPGSLNVTLGPEIDWLADADGHGRHPAMIQLVGLSAPIASRLTVLGDLWGNWNFDPDGTVRQASADAALAYAATSDLQLDVGANFGLNRDTPDIEIYGGVSVRF